MKGLMKVHHAAQTQAAWRDWRRLAAEARAMGIDPTPFEPKPDAGWRTIDHQYDRLAQAMRERGARA